MATRASGLVGRGQKTARRDLGLTSAEVDELKALVIAKLPKQDKAA
jgi:hypothetical protein